MSGVYTVHAQLYYIFLYTKRTRIDKPGGMKHILKHISIIYLRYLEIQYEIMILSLATTFLR